MMGMPRSSEIFGRLSTNLIAFAGMLAMLVSTASAQERRPEWATSRMQLPQARTTAGAVRPAVHNVPSVPERGAHSNVRPVSHKDSKPAETPKSIDLGPGPDFASQLPDDESHLVQFVEVLQWTMVVALLAVFAVMAIKKYSRPGGMIPTRSSAIAHLGTLPVKNHFQAHLLEIGNQRFLVTTDRTGVKTVNPINSWQDFDTPVQETHDATAA